MNIGETLKFITDRGTYYKIFQSLFMDLTIYAFFGPLNSFKCGLLNVHIGAAPGGSVGNNEEPAVVNPHLTIESRTPTPKILLNTKNGTLQWPVYQVGGAPGSGMLISTSSMLQVKKTRVEQNPFQPGRENFMLGEQIPDVLRTKVHATVGDDDRKLIGWLQIRDRQQKKKSFLQVVHPAAEGPFRKAPWHGNIHVLKF